MISPGMKIVYLIGISVACFMIKAPSILVGVALVHLAIWFWAGLTFSALLRAFRRLSFFIALILISFSLIPMEAMSGDVWKEIPLLGLTLSVNLTGLTFGLLMSLRVVIVVVASMTIQLSGRPGEFVEGLRAIRIPQIVALTVDSTLHLLGPGAPRKPGSGGGMGGGKGGGRQGGQGNSDFDRAGEALTWKRIVRGDFGFLLDWVESSLKKAITHLRATHPKLDPRMLNDAAIISGICLLMMTAKLLKVMPGVPFAPGHKLVILVPLYILAAEMTHSRWGSTITGTTIGVVSFLFGDGRFGIFEILKHITPGIVVDLTLPALKKLQAQPSRLVLAVVGAVCAAVRIATIVAVTLLIEAPPLFYLLIVPMVVSQTAFGAVSGFVTFYLLKYVGRLKALTAPEMAEVGEYSDTQTGSAGSGNGNGRGRNRRLDSESKPKNDSAEQVRTES